MITEFGQQVLGSVSPPPEQGPRPTTVTTASSRSPTSSASEFLNNIVKREGREPTEEEVNEAVRMRRTDAGLPASPETIGKFNNPFTEETTRPNLLQTQQRDDLFPEAGEPLVHSSMANNRAYSESLILQDPESFEARAKEQASGNVQDEAILRLNAVNVEQGILDTVNLGGEGRTGEELVGAIKASLLAVDFQKLKARDVLLFEYFMQGGGSQSLEQFEKTRLDTSPSVTEAVRARTSRRQSHRLRMAVDDIVARQDIGGFGDMFQQAARQDFIPIINVVSRIGLDVALLEAAGGETKGVLGSILPGEIRQETRTFLLSLPPNERVQAVVNMGKELEKLEKHPVYAPLITQYGVLETMEGIFTEDFLSGKSDKNTMDRVLGNLDVVLEAVFSIGFLASFGRAGVRATFRGTDKLRAKQVARDTVNARMASKFDEILGDGGMGSKFGLELDEAVGTQLPRPARFLNDTDEIPQGTKDVVVRNQRVRSEILDSTDGLTGAGLNAGDRSTVIHRAVAELDMGDSMVVQPKMSAIRELENGTGFEIDAVIGKTAEGGWTSFDEVVDDLLQLDPNLEKFEIVRVTDSGVLGPVFKDHNEFLQKVFKGAEPEDGVGQIAGLENAYYLRYKQERFWHTADKQSFGAETFLSTGVLPRAILPPNARFGNEIYGTFVKAYMGEQAIIKNFEIMFKPFYSLGIKDKKFVTSAFEWMEDFGKEFGRAPDLSETLSKYDGITEAQLSGLSAMRDGMDTMHELFNRRLFREFQAQGFKTARPSQGNLPTFHGTELPRITVPRGKYLDPVSGKIVAMTPAEMDDFYNAGGRVMKTDIAVDAADEARAQADLILIDPGKGYEMGELSTRPLVYHPGYSLRFYDDPYFIVKTTNGITLNGATRSGGKASTSEAIRTAGTQTEADAFLARIEPKEGVSWEVVRARDISQTENTLMQKQAIHREGRMFWDQRNFDRLPDVNGNRAKLEDPVQSLEKGVALAARQATHEDPLKMMKGAFEEEYADLVSRGEFDNKSMKEIIDSLTQSRRNATDTGLKTRYNEAIELVKYFRLISGTESTLIPAMREGALGVASTVARMTGGRATSRTFEKYAQQMDPFRTMRTIAFNVFMTFRPVRQALLQSLQVSYLAPLAPGYVASGRMFKDAFGLRRGLTALRKSGYDDGFSVKNAAKQMNLTEQEYRKLIKEWDRSGILDLVDVHSFSGGARKFDKQPIPQSPIGEIGYRVRQATSGTREFLQKVGFNFGEGNNLTFTYALALRRFQDKTGKGILEISPKEWDDLRLEASNLALGMIRPNNFGYQSGAMGVATQFLSFSHKAALGMMGANPAIKGEDALKIIFGTYLLYGANMFGARDLAEQELKKIGVPDQPIPGTNGATIVDFVANGLVETTFNRLADLSSDDYKDLDLSFLAPGVDLDRIWEMQIENIMHQPAKTVFGPFGGIFSKFLQSLDFAHWYKNGNPDIEPADKFAIVADHMMRGAFPQYNDLVTSYMGYQLNLWYSASGEALPLRPTMNGLLARGLVGARTREELSYYKLQNEQWESDSFYKEVIDKNKKHMINLINRWNKGEITAETVRTEVQMLNNLTESFPEGRRNQVLEASMLTDQDDGGPSVKKQLVEMMKSRQATPEIATRLDELLPDVPVEQRQQIRQLMLDSIEKQQKVDEVAEQTIREQR